MLLLYLLEGLVLAGLGVELLKLDLALHLLLVLAREDHVPGGALQLYKMVLGHRENLPERLVLGNYGRLPRACSSLLLDLEVRFPVLHGDRDGTSFHNALTHHKRGDRRQNGVLNSSL